LQLHKIVEVNTVDSFQGREKDTIIISCVRASRNQESGIGFLNDYRRMNVAITRAKNFLWVVGHAKTLNMNKNWGDLIRYCYKNDFIKCFGAKTHKIANILEDRVKRISDCVTQICIDQANDKKLNLGSWNMEATQNENPEKKVIEIGEIDPFGEEDLNSKEVFDA